jgi:dihydrolipoamide dehydrogenase
MTSANVESVDTSGELCKVNVKTATGIEVLEAEIVLSAVGISTNIEGIGLEEVGVKTERGKVLVDDFYKTNVEGVYAIGDIVKGQALAHVASAEGIICVEKIAGQNPHPLDYNNIPGCTYCSPEVASVGYTEKAAKEAGYEIKVGKFPFSASGKASAAGAKDGFVKLIFDAKYGEFLGRAHAGLQRYRNDCRSSYRPQAGSYRSRDHQIGTPAPNHERSRNGSRRRSLRRSNTLVS